MSKKIDITKPIRLISDNRPVHIISDEGRYITSDGLQFKLLGYIADNQALSHWDEYGKGISGEINLANVPDIGEVWVNIYKSSESAHFRGSVHRTKERAGQFFAKPDVLACVKVNFTVGQFDE